MYWLEADELQELLWLGRSLAAVMGSWVLALAVYAAHPPEKERRVDRTSGKECHLLVPVPCPAAELVGRFVRIVRTFQHDPQLDGAVAAEHRRLGSDRMGIEYRVASWRT